MERSCPGASDIGILPQPPQAYKYYRPDILICQPRLRGQHPGNLSDVRLDVQLAGPLSIRIPRTTSCGLAKVNGAPQDKASPFL